MFVKKLVDKASSKPGGGGNNCDGLKRSDVDPRLTFHYGIPSGATAFAYDPTLQTLLAISTRDGRIKLFGRDSNTQALLHSQESVPTKFVQFIHTKGFLLNVTSTNHIEVWDVDKKLLCHVHAFREHITSFVVLQHTPYIYIGDSAGNVSVFKFDPESCRLSQMKYTIPSSASRGHPTDHISTDDTAAVLHILPQPTAESKRVLVLFRDGLITLWDIWISRSIFSTGGSLLQSQYHDTKTLTSACWACPFGSRLAVGYSNGEILIWSIPTDELSDNNGAPTVPLSKLNLGYKVAKVPIVSLKCVHADGKASRLYVMGASDVESSNLVQVILLNEQTETRTVKLVLPISESCIDMEIISSTCEQTKCQEDYLMLLGKSGQVHAYNDTLIEKHLLQSQTRSSPSLPKEVRVKMPFVDSSITVSKFITHDPYFLSGDEDYIQLAKNIPSLFSFEAKPKDGTRIHFSGFTKVKNLYITGHSDGAINFWDASCPFFIPILSLKQQSEDDFSLSGIPLTALYFDSDSRLLVSGDQSGMVRIYKFKPEPYATENSFLSFQGSSKRGNNHIHQSIKLMKVNGSVVSMNVNLSSGHLAIGSDQGDVSVIDTNGPSLLYQQHIASEISTGITSLQFETCSLHGFEKNVLVVATKDSSVLALEASSGNMLSSSTVHPKKPSRALFMQILDANKEALTDDAPKQSFVLICSEKAVYLYSFNHVVQGLKKVHYKKKFNSSSSCCWASTFSAANDVGLLLLFCNGGVEIRSLPELTLLKESSIRGFTYSPPKLNSSSQSSICCSEDGELVMIHSDQEMSVMSVLFQKENFRLLDSVSQVYRKDLIPSPDGLTSGSMVHKEKKKGLFSSVIKGSKPKQILEVETQNNKESLEELSSIFSTANFAYNSKNKESLAMDADGSDMDIDDIVIDDPGEKPKDQNMLAALNKQKLANKFQAFKGKIKQMKPKNEKNISREEEKDETGGAVDQIKKKYGFSSSGETTAAKIAESKLYENLRKLQGISLKTTDMQDTARSFSSMAKEVLRITEKDRGSS